MSFGTIPTLTSYTSPNRDGSLPLCCLSMGPHSPVHPLLPCQREEGEHMVSMSLDTTTKLNTGLQTQEPTSQNSSFINIIKCNVFKWKADCNSL